MGTINFESLSVDRLHTLWEDAGNGGSPIRIIDVRTPGEYAHGHIPGAVTMPLDRLPASFGELPKDSDIYLICLSGMRSMQAAGYLAAQGFDRLYNVSGGMASWSNAGYPVER